MSSKVMERIKHNGTIYQYKDGGILKGYVKAPMPPDPPDMAPYIQWCGNKMAYSLWESILAFFDWTCRESKGSPDEAMVRIYYNEDSGQWLVWAPPQRGHGMSVKTIDDHVNWKQEQGKEFEGFLLVGTGHHHCHGSAFQSGTDKDDEKCCNGLHFTVGKLDKPFVDLHARVVWNGNMQDTDLSLWVELAPKYAALNLPPELITRAYDYTLQTKPPENTPFPQAWKDNYHRGWVNNVQGGHHTSGYYGGYRGTTYEKKDGVVRVIGGGSGTVNGNSIMNPSDRGTVELNNMLREGVSLTEICQVAVAINEKGDKRTKFKDWPKGVVASKIYALLHNNGLNPRWLEKWCEDEVGRQMQLTKVDELETWREWGGM